MEDIQMATIRMEDVEDFVLTQHYYLSSQTLETAMFLQQNPLPNLSLTGPLAQHRQRNFQSRLLQSARGQAPLPPLQRTGSLAQVIPGPRRNLPSASPTSNPSTTADQQAYHQSQALYAQMRLRLNLLIMELTEEIQRRGRRGNSPRDPLVSIHEKQQEIAALLERIDAIAQGVQDLTECEDGVWRYSSSFEGDDGDDDEATAAGSSLGAEMGSGGSGLSGEEVNEVVEEAWRDVYPESELELVRYPGMYR